MVVLRARYPGGLEAKLAGMRSTKLRPVLFAWGLALCAGAQGLVLGHAGAEKSFPPTMLTWWPTKKPCVESARYFWLRYMKLEALI